MSNISLPSDYMNCFYFVLGSEVKLFGSLSTGLGSPDSDADLAVFLPGGISPDCEVIDQAKSAFQASPHLYQQIHTRARLPAITFYFVPGDIICDVHFRVEPVETLESSLLHYLLHIDERALNLAILVKHWAKLHELICRKYLTSYGMMMLVIFFLQQRSILPSVVDLQNNVPVHLLNCTHPYNVAFEEQTIISKNNESLYDLFGGFFEYYDEFDFDEFMVSPFIGQPVNKSLFEDLDTVPDEFCSYKRDVANNITPSFNITSISIQSLIMLNDNCAWRVDTTTKFNTHFKSAAKSYRENKECSFLKAIGINIS